MDNSLRQKLDDLVESLTTSGSKELSIDQLVEVTNICQLSPCYIDHVIHLLKSQFINKHAQIRLSSFQLFSHLLDSLIDFRKLAVLELQSLLQWLVPHDKIAASQTPKPHQIAEELHKLVLTNLILWHEKYCGINKQAYPHLYAVYKYISTNSLCRHQIQTLKQEHDLALTNLRIKRQEQWSTVEEDIQEYKTQIQESINTLQTAFQILAPQLDPFDLNKEQPDPMNDETLSTYSRSTVDSTAAYRLHGFMNKAHMDRATMGLRINLKNNLIQRTDDNRELLDSMKDAYNWLTKRGLVKLDKWLHVMEICDKRDQFDEISQLREQTMKLIEKCDVAIRKSWNDHDDSSSSDDDFVDVMSNVNNDDPYGNYLDTNMAPSQSPQKVGKGRKRRYPGLVQLTDKEKKSYHSKNKTQQPNILQNLKKMKTRKKT